MFHLPRRLPVTPQHSPCSLASCIGNPNWDIWTQSGLNSSIFCLERRWRTSQEFWRRGKAFWQRDVWNYQDGMAIRCSNNQIRSWGLTFLWQKRVTKRNCWNKRDVWAVITVLMQLAIIQLHPWSMLDKCKYVLSLILFFSLKDILSVILFSYTHCVRKRTQHHKMCKVYSIFVNPTYFALYLAENCVGGKNHSDCLMFQRWPQKNSLCIAKLFTSERLSKLWKTALKLLFHGRFSPCFNNTTRRRGKIEFIASNFINIWTEISLASKSFLSRASHFISHF